MNVKCLHEQWVSRLWSEYWELRRLSIAAMGEYTSLAVGTPEREEKRKAYEIMSNIATEFFDRNLEKYATYE